MVGLGKIVGGFLHSSRGVFQTRRRSKLGYWSGGYSSALCRYAVTSKRWRAVRMLSRRQSKLCSRQWAHLLGPFPSLLLLPVTDVATTSVMGMCCCCWMQASLVSLDNRGFPHTPALMLHSGCYGSSWTSRSNAYSCQDKQGSTTCHSVEGHLSAYPNGEVTSWSVVHSSKTPAHTESSTVCNAETRQQRRHSEVYQRITTRTNCIWRATAAATSGRATMTRSPILHRRR